MDAPFAEPRVLWFPCSRLRPETARAPPPSFTHARSPRARGERGSSPVSCNISAAAQLSMTSESVFGLRRVWVRLRRFDSVFYAASWRRTRRMGRKVPLKTPVRLRKDTQFARVLTRNQPGFWTSNMWGLSNKALLFELVSPAFRDPFAFAEKPQVFLSRIVMSLFHCTEFTVFGTSKSLLVR